MAKIGRNQPCPCGSGKKYKRCHGLITGGAPNFNVSDAFSLRLQEIEAEEAQRKKQQGLGRAIISDELQGQRMVAVGSRVYFSPNWRTFHDFLREYIFVVLGREWVKAQRAKPANERHQIIRWFDQAVRDTQKMAADKAGIRSGPMTGAQRAFLNLAYNIYLIAHHTEPKKSETILNSFLQRLKSARTDDFVGKLFEMYASAAFLKAGFIIEYENEKDGTDSHVEFTATYPRTGRKFSVEVKTRNRSAEIDGRVDDAKRLRVGQKLVKALKKNAKHDRIFFIEVNIPDIVGEVYYGTWIDSALSQIAEAEGFLNVSGQHYDPAYVVVTNHAFHNNLESAGIGLQAIAEGYRIPDFGPNTKFIRLGDYLENLDRHQEMFSLFDSIKEHSSIPITFDGEIPEFAFQIDDVNPRLRIGHEYLVPDSSGEQILGVLEQAVVMESWGKAHCVYRLPDGRRIFVSHELRKF